MLKGTPKRTGVPLMLDDDLFEWIDKLREEAMAKGEKVSRNAAINQVIRAQKEQAEKGETK